MRHQVFSRYYQLSLEGKVEPLRCLYENHTLTLMPKYNFEDEVTYLECPECFDKIYPGQSLYFKLIDRINIADPYPEDSAFDKFK